MSRYLLTCFITFYMIVIWIGNGVEMNVKLIVIAFTLLCIVLTTHTEIIYMDKNMRPSEFCIAKIKEIEGFKPKIYLCEARKPTIGYGELVRNDTPKALTEEIAEQRLRARLDKVAKLLHAKIIPQITQAQFDALIMLVDNWGAHNFAVSRCLTEINDEDWFAAMREWGQVVHVRKDGQLVVSNGLKNRRKQELELFASGIEKRDPNHSIV